MKFVVVSVAHRIKISIKLQFTNLRIRSVLFNKVVSLSVKADRSVMSAGLFLKWKLCFIV